MKLKPSCRRAYRMGRRAAAAAQTADRILDAAEEIFWKRPTDQISLEDVARRAGVTVQTVIRRFGGKDGLFSAGAERAAQRVQQQRENVATGDVAGAVATLIDHYEELGDRMLRLLAEEHRVPKLRSVADHGRELHARWCERVFAPVLATRRGAERKRRLAQLVAVCDVYMWKLLRRDRGLSRRDCERALAQLVRMLME
jgi:AcrR family transcriptional regulator